MQRKEGFIVTIKIKDERGNVVGETEAITYKGLLSLAHDDGLRLVRTKLVQLPDEANGRTAVVRATVRTRRGVFAGVGDACPGNVNRRVASHLIRVAETRAIARALRIAVNIGEVAIEELGDDGELEIVATAALETRMGRTIPATPPQEATHESRPERFRGRDTSPTEALPSDRRSLSEEQKKLLFRLAYELGDSRDSAAARVLEALKVQRFEHATRADASRAIDELKRQAAAKKGNGRGTHGEASHADA